MNSDDKVTVVILGNSIKAAVLLVLATLMLGGCCSGTCGDQIVHPTDEQTANVAKGGATKDAPYVPWWVEEKVPNSAGVVVGE